MFPLKAHLIHKGNISYLFCFVGKTSRSSEPARLSMLRACLHEGGEPQVGEVTRGWLPHLACKGDQIKMRDYDMDRRVTPPKRVTSPTSCPTPQCKQALKVQRVPFASKQIHGP